ncbi:hypothetical protein [Micromonospora pisi]|uniref:hypothetical protein n=1 Tax=Micromonospora pisi TaxID=589240 RepID=UPI0011C3CC86|nr:hypothetical protein [Micromonospora pisi]
MLDDLDAHVTRVVEQYEQDGPAALAPDLVSQRQLIQPLLQAWHRAHHRDRLFRAAARMSGQLSYMAINLGHFDSARAYGLEAFSLADHVNDDELRAWVRGTQSLTEYYAASYGQALELARDGRCYAGGGQQAVRLAVNGEARALGKLGERSAVDRAIGEAYDLLDAFPRQAGMTPCISFGLYSEARTAANAATARLALAQPVEALAYAGRALEVVDASPSMWSRALVRLDMAAAVTSTSRPDLEHAAALMREAMTAANTHRIESIRQRTISTAQDLSAWSAEPVVSELPDEFTHWLANGSPNHDTT